MRILLVSDTHRHGGNFYELLDGMDSVDLIIHCGDVEGQEDEFEEVVRATVGCPIVMVAGNNDFFAPLPQERELFLEGYRLMVTHGHHYYVSMGTELISQEAKARNFDIVIFGHTHRPLVERKEGVLVINPGSLSYPRQEGRRPSYAILELEKENTCECEICFL